MITHGYKIKFKTEDGLKSEEPFTVARAMLNLGEQFLSGLHQSLDDGLERTVNCAGVDVSIMRTRKES